MKKTEKKTHAARWAILALAAALLALYLAVPAVKEPVNDAVAILASSNVETVAAWIRGFGGAAMAVSFGLMVFSSVVAPVCNSAWFRLTS